MPAPTLPSTRRVGSARPATTTGPGDRVARRGSRRAVVGLGLTCLLALAGACSGAPEFDREAAIGRVVDSTGGVVDREQAGCYVDQVREQLGPGPLLEGAEPQPEQLRQLTSIKIDCFGIEHIGASTSRSSEPPSTIDGAVPEPMTRGEDPALDALWDQCEAGSGLACDQLFEQAPLGSEYESFAVTCGNRTQELRCAEAYPGGAAAE